MLRTIKFVLHHPFNKGHRFSAFLNLLKWQLSSRISRLPVVYQFTQNSKLWAWKGLAGATGNIYCGLHEFEEMAFLLHLLRSGDLFIDIGANIGSYSMLASAEIGANTIAIEPVPKTYQHLTKNIALNNTDEKVTALNIGLSNEKGVLKFTELLDTSNHVVDDETSAFIKVDVDTLDNILGGKEPILIKIDVEGFEMNVLNGASKALQSSALKAIIIELNGSGLKYGFNDDDIDALLIKKGFKVMEYSPFKRELSEGSRNKVNNTLYVRDEGFVAARVKTAATIRIQNRPL